MGLGRKAFIVTDQMMVKLGNVSKVTAFLEKARIAYSVFDQVNTEPTDVFVREALAQYRREGCDYFIAVGGGSPIDAMKAVSVLAANPGEIRDYMGRAIPNATPPCVAIPTTAGTGSEATDVTIITDTENDVKMLLKSGHLLPSLAIVDPVFTLTVPPAVTAATGVDALTHAIEAYISGKANPLSDLLALSAIEKIHRYLPVAYRDGADVEARAAMSLAAFEAGSAFSNASVTIVHGMSRPIGALFHVAHGISNAMLLTECLRFVADGAVPRLAVLARRIGIAGVGESDEKAADAFISEIDRFCRALDIPSLAAYGIDRDKYFAVIDKMARDAMASGSPQNSLKAVTEEDIRKVYQNLWHN